MASSGSTSDKTSTNPTDKNDDHLKKKSSMSIMIGKPNKLSAAMKPTTKKLTMSLANTKPPEIRQPIAPKTKAIAAAFNTDDDSDEEDMPLEAKMRMRNVGKYTPTAAGPNSFGKGRLGFSDRRKELEREIQRKLDEEEDRERERLEALSS